MGDAPQTTNPTQVTPQVADDRAVGAVVPSVVKSIASSPPAAPAQPQTPSRAKELGSAAVSESAPIIEVSTGAATIEQEPIPPEVQAWMEKVGSRGEEIKLDNLPAVQVQPPAAPAPQGSKTAFVLPLGEAELKSGMNASVNDSIKWLAVWCQKVIKQLRGQIVFRSN